MHILWTEFKNIHLIIRSEAEALSRELNMRLYRTSVKDDLNVSVVFQHLAENYVNKVSVIILIIMHSLNYTLTVMIFCQELKCFLFIIFTGTICIVYEGESVLVTGGSLKMNQNKIFLVLSKIIWKLRSSFTVTLIQQYIKMHWWFCRLIIKYVWRRFVELE